MGGALSETAVHSLEAMAGILLRCFIITVAASIFTFLVGYAFGDAIYQIHTIFFDISRKDFDLFFLCSLTLIKVLNVMFFLFPFLAIKHFLLNRK